MNQSVLENQNPFLDVMKRAFEKGKQEDTTLHELVEEIKEDLRVLEIKKESI